MKKLLQLCSVLMLGLLFLAGNAQAQTFYVDANLGTDIAGCGGSTGAGACASLTGMFGTSGQAFTTTTTIQVTGVTTEPDHVVIGAALTGVAIVGVEADPTSPNFAGVTVASPINPGRTIINVQADDVEVRNLALYYTVGGAYNEGRLLRTENDNTIFDNLTLGSLATPNALRGMVNFNVASTNGTISNSRFIGLLARTAVSINGGSGHVVSNNLFQYTQVGFDDSGNIVQNPMAASVFIGRSQVLTALVEFNRFDVTVVDDANPANNDGPTTAIYIEGGWPLVATDDILVRHNTIAMNGVASTRDVHGIYFDIDTITPIPNANNNALTSLSNGYIRVIDNVITGAVDSVPGDGSSYGLYVPIAFGPAFASYNLFFGNEDDSNNSIDVATGPANGNNITGADPLFDGTDEFGYNSGSPALASSSSFTADPMDMTSPNRGYNQEVNADIPDINTLVASGVAPQNPSTPFIPNHPIDLSWVFDDDDSPQDDMQSNFIVEINPGLVYNSGTVFYTFDDASFGYVGSSTTHTLPAGTLPNFSTDYTIRVTVFDAIGLSDFEDIVVSTTANNPPTASLFTVDGAGPNPAVNNVNPEFGFQYDDLDGDAMDRIIVDVYRISANCGVNCPPLGGPVPNSGGLVPGVLAASTEIPWAANAGDPATFNLYDLVPIVEQLIANESYVWYLRVRDDQGNWSTEIYNNFVGAGTGLMTFTTVPLGIPAVSDFLVQANAAPLFKDNSVSPRVVLGTAVAPPNLRFTYNGFDTMKSYEIRIVRTNPAVTTTPQGDLTGGTPVFYTGILAASDPNLNEYAPKQYEWAYQGPLAITNNQTHFAQVRVYNQQNQASDWQYIEFTRNATPTATDFLADGDGMLPVPVGVTDDIVPTITWTFSDADEAKSPDDEGQSAFHIQIFDNAGFAGTPIIDTGKVPSTVSSYDVTPDFRLEYDFVYFVRIRVWDGLDVPNSPGTWIDAGAFETPPNQLPTLTDILLDGAADGTPSVNFTLNATPQFDWTFTDPEGRDQFQYSAVLNDVTNTLSYPFAAPVPGNASTYVLNPADFVGFPGFIPGNDYEFELTVWDATSDGSDAPVVGSPVTDAYPFRFVTYPSAPADLAVTPTRAGGTLVSSLTPTFTFTPTDADGEPALTFQIQIQDAANTNIGAPYDGPAGSYANGVPVVVTLATMYPGLDLDANANYRWRVYTTDQHGDGVTSAWQTFTVDPVPGAPTALTVNGFGTGNPGLLNLPLGSPNATFTFGWSDNDHGDPATGHSIVIYETANPGNVVYSEPAGLGGSPQVETTSLPLVPGTTYTWELRTSDASGMGFLPAEYSPIVSQNFRVSAAPTAVDLLVDGVAANPEVLTVFPTFSWTFGDVDLDTQTASEVIVTRTSTLCGGLPVCQPAPHLVWSSGKLVNVNPSVVFGDGGPIIEGILPGESYSWTLRVWDSNDIPSIVYNSTFTASENLPVEISSLTLDAQSYVPGGTPATRWLEPSLNVATGTPTFAWVFGGPGAQAKYQIEVSTSPTFAAGQFVWQTGEVVSGDVSVAYAGGALAQGTTYYARVRAFNGQNLASPFGYIEFELNQAPLASTSFQADGLTLVDDINTTNTVDDRTPTLTWVFADPNTANATDEQTEFEVQIATATDFLSVLFSYSSCAAWTGNVCTTDNPAIDGTLSSLTVPVDQLRFGTAYAVRVRAYDKHGVPGPWTKGAFRTPTNAVPVISALAVSDGNPATNPAQVLSLEPDFDWNFSDTDGHGHGFSRVEIFRVDGNVLVYDTGIVADASSAHAFNAANLVGPGLVWGEDYTARVVSWDDFSDPLSFGAGAPNPPNDITEQVSNALTLNFSTSAFNLVPVSLAVNPSVINTLQTATITAQLSTPYAWATLTFSTGVETFFASIQADAAGEASMSSGALAAGNYTFRAFETPVQLTAGNYLASTYGNGASFVQASLQVVNAGGLLGDANQSGTVSALDAVFILQYTAGLQTMTPAQLALGDVDGVAGVNSFDAALILQYDASIITCFPLNCPPKTAAVEPDASIASARADASKDIVLSVSGSEMLSVQYTVDLAAAGLSVADVTLGSPEGWMVASNEQDGVLTVSMAGARSVGSVDFLTLSTANVTDSKQLNVAMVVNNQALAASLEIAPALPDEFALGQNFPNPFNPSTEIAFSLPADANVVLEVYSVTGQKVATLVSGPVKAGAHTVRFDASRLSSGVYIYRIQAGSFTASQKMTLIK